MLEKESYQAPVAQVIMAMEAYAVLTVSDYDGNGIEDPFDYGTWN